MSENINWLGNKVVDSVLPNQTQSRKNAGNSTYASRTPYTPMNIADDSIPYKTQQIKPAIVSQTARTPQQVQTPSLQQSSELPFMEQGPPPSTEVGYIPYYLTQNIGRSVRAEFIIGNSQYADKTGILIEVGINYFVLDDPNSRTHIMCDLYSVKFVTILQD